MNYSKIDLSRILAVGHEDNSLEILIDRGHSIESIELPAPVEAYEGLQQLNDIIADETDIATPSAPFSLPPASSPQRVKSVASSMANSISYDPEHSVLELEFNSGTVYQYEGVEPETWQALQVSDSVGRFYNREIKRSYRSHRCL